MSSYLGKNPREAIQAFLDDNIDGTALRRCLMSWGDWRVPAQIDDAGQPGFSRFSTEDGQKFFRVFSDKQALDDLFAELGDDAMEPEFIQTIGWSVFANLDEELDWVDINPRSQPDIHYKQHQLPMLRQMAQAVRVEAVLYDLASATDDAAMADAGGVANPLGLVKGFEHYQVVLKERGPDDYMMVMAPDSKGRQLSAVFTAEDTVRAFMSQLAEISDDQHQVLAINGARLFGQLQQMPIDGIVFNCCGPIRPCALAPQLCQLVLNADA